MGTIHRDTCPVCGSDRLRPGPDVTDHMVSGEVFHIVHCRSCSAAFTQDAPDTDSIAPYYASDDYISHSDTRDGLLNRIYHAVRGRMLRRKMRWVQRNASGTRAIDIGAGTGYFCESLTQAGFEATGYEPDERARTTAEERGVTLHPMEAFTDRPADSADVVTMWHVLEHVHDLHGMVQHIRAVMSANGTLILALPNHRSADARVYGAAWKAWDVPKHLYHFTPEAVDRLCDAHDLVVYRRRQLPFDPFYIALLSEQQSGSWWTALLRLPVVPLWSWLRGAITARSASSVVYFIKKRPHGA